MSRKAIRSAYMVVLLAWAVSLCVPAVGSALPGGRHYEMVSPSYKGGYGVNSMQGAAMAGEAEGASLVFDSLGTFAGEPNGGLAASYIARRGALGWSTGPELVPTATAPVGVLNDISPTLTLGLFYGFPGANGGAAEFDATEPMFLLHRLDTPDSQANFTVAGMSLKRFDGKPINFTGSIASSPDFCHVLLRTTIGSSEPEPLLPAAVGTKSFLYDLATAASGCTGGPSLRLIGVSNKLIGVSNKHGEVTNEPEVIDPKCEVFLGANDLKEGNVFNAVAAGGTEIFMTTNANRAEPLCDGPNGSQPGNPAILYVRLNGERTVQISGSRERAEFVGANEAGTRVFFMTKESLVTGDSDSGKDLYMATIGCPPVETGCEPSRREVTSLVQVSHDPNLGEAAEVQGVSLISPDGGRVYFVARGVLSGANAEGKWPVKGADNLYVYNVEEGTTHLVADLCSSPQQSGEAVELRCPGNLTSGGEGGAHGGNDVGVWGTWKEVQTTGDGRFFLFTSYAQLVGSDTDTARDVYRYDAQSERLDRVSVGEEGYDANGNNDSFNAELPALQRGGLVQQGNELSYRAISEDGSRIVFETAESLSPNDVNGLVNAYEWHKEDGWSKARVSLVSSGSDEEPVGERSGVAEQIAITPSGRDIFFMTVQGLLPQDSDGADDIYDARLGEDFPAKPAQRQSCAGDACQGPLTAPAPLLVPGSVVQGSGENFVPATKVSKRKKKTRAKKLRKKAKLKKGKTSRSSHKSGKSAGGIKG